MSFPSIYLASPEGANGRNVVANGLAATLAQAGKKPAIFHPITHKRDAFTEVLIKTARLEETVDEARAVCPKRAMSDHAYARQEVSTYWETFQSRLSERGAESCLIVGRDKNPAFDPEGFVLDAQLSADLQAPVFLAVCCINRQPDQVRRTVEACYRQILQAGNSVAGVFVTGWKTDEAEKGAGIKQELTDLFSQLTPSLPCWLIPAHDCSTADEAAQSLPRFQKAAPAEEILAALDRTDFAKPVTPYAFQASLVARAKKDKRRIVLPEGQEDRILQAADQILSQDAVDLIIVGEKEEILARGRELGLTHLEKAGFQSQKDEDLLAPMVEKLCQLRAKKGMTPDKARQTLHDPSYFGTMLVVMGMADGLVSGSVNTTANTVRPALQLIKTKPGASLVSGAFLMCLPDHVAVFADCAINPNPDAGQLADIAIQSAQTAKAFGIDPRVGMLTYSTLGSGSGPDVDMVAEATRLVGEKAPDLPVVGPIQMDAAWSPQVAATKAKGNPVAGHVNVFVFPDLSAGNIGYKAVQRSSGALAIGPVLQGLNKPVNDLSRGASVSDIVNTIALTAIYAEES